MLWVPNTDATFACSVPNECDTQKALSLVASSYDSNIIHRIQRKLKSIAIESLGKWGIISLIVYIFLCATVARIFKEWHIELTRGSGLKGIVRRRNHTRLCSSVSPECYLYRKIQPRLHFDTLVPCLKQTPPCTTCFSHPIWLQRFSLAPCLTQTPPCWTLLSHPIWLQRFSLAPCLIQTPPCWTILSHPIWLQRFTLAPCLRRFHATFSLLCLMPRTHLA